MHALDQSSMHALDQSSMYALDQSVCIVCVCVHVALLSVHISFPSQEPVEWTGSDGMSHSPCHYVRMKTK